MSAARTMTLNASPATSRGFGIGRWINGAIGRRTALRGASIGVYTSTMRRIQPSTRSVRVGLLRRRKVLRLAAALPWALLATSCGQKGPLYHPPEPDEEDEDEQTTAAPPAPGSRLG